MLWLCFGSGPRPAPVGPVGPGQHIVTSCVWAHRCGEAGEQPEGKARVQAFRPLLVPHWPKQVTSLARAHGTGVDTAAAQVQRWRGHRTLGESKPQLVTLPCENRTLECVQASRPLGAPVFPHSPFSMLATTPFVHLKLNSGF